MARRMFSSLALAFTLLVTLATLHRAALAGPPLICHPLEIGNARSLPWSGPEWRAVKADYDLNRLVEDTLALLTPETPTLVRMETLRRATVYAVWAKVDREVGYKVADLRVANDLLSRLAARATEAKGKGKVEALALFDHGYLIESYKQAAHDGGKGLNLAAAGDGYASVAKAIALRGGDPEMEFAAALISLHPRRETHSAHLQKAVAGAADGSLLARNLTTHFSSLGRTVGEMRTKVGLAKN